MPSHVTHHAARDFVDIITLFYMLNSILRPLKIVVVQSTYYPHYHLKFTHGINDVEPLRSVSQSGI